MLLRYIYYISPSFIILVNGRQCEVKALKVNYQTEYDFVCRASEFETELGRTLHDWKEKKIELDVCIVHDLVDCPRKSLGFYRIRATPYDKE